MLVKFLKVLTGTILLAGSAQALVVGGGVTGGSASANGGVFQQLNTAVPFSVGNNQQQSFNLFAFNELQGVILGAPLAVDILGPISAGTRVNSHYVFFDPARDATMRGFVDFDAPIIGIATSLATLVASDFLGNPNVTYLSPLLRGLEGADVVSIAPGFNGQRNRINFLRASTPGDYIRVFTAAAVPEPGTWVMMIAGFGFAGLASRRRRSVRVTA